VEKREGKWVGGIFLVQKLPHKYCDNEVDSQSGNKTLKLSIIRKAAQA
jgi:hypothetical protein